VYRSLEPAGGPAAILAGTALVGERRRRQPPTRPPRAPAPKPISTDQNDGHQLVAVTVTVRAPRWLDAVLPLANSPGMPMASSPRTTSAQVVIPVTSPADARRVPEEAPATNPARNVAAMAVPASYQSSCW
jgi:hypothetical protein